MSERTCNGLPADWLNGWLAAVGATVLVDGMRLRWAGSGSPVAVLSLPGDADPLDAISATWPSLADMAAWPIADIAPDGGVLPLNPTVEQWRARVAAARTGNDSWMLSSLFTDLVFNHHDRVWSVGRGVLHPPAPTGRTMHHRLSHLSRTAVDRGGIARSLDGIGERSGGQGLGFDLGRVGSLADSSSQSVDPVVEILAFHGLALLPLRGSESGYLRQRGVSPQRSVSWSAWSRPLDRWAIDALLDRAESWPPDIDELGRWSSISFEAQSSMDPTRGHGSKRTR